MNQRRTGRVGETALMAAFALTSTTIGLATLAEASWFSLRKSAAVRQATCLDDACGLAANRQQVAWIALLTAGALVCAAALVIAIGAMHARRLRPFPFERFPAVAALATTTGMQHLLRWDPDRPVAGALARGLRTPMVEVGLDVLALSVTDPLAASAVLEHERGHLVARDVLPSELVYWSVVVFAVAALGVMLIVDTPSARGLVVGRIAVQALAVFLARSALLRARELEADQFADRAVPGGMARALGVDATAADSAGEVPTPGEPTRPLRRNPLLHRIGALVAHHPERALRARYLAGTTSGAHDRTALFGLVGFTLGVGATALGRIVRLWFVHGDPSLFADAIAWSGLSLALGAWLFLYHRSVVAETDNEHRSVIVLVVVFLLATTTSRLPLSLRPDLFPGTLAGFLGVAALSTGLGTSALAVRELARLFASENARWRIAVGAASSAGIVAAVTTPLVSLSSNSAILDNVAHATVLGLDPNHPYTALMLLTTAADEWFFIGALVIPLILPAVLLATRRLDIPRRLAPRVAAATVAGTVSVVFIGRLLKHWPGVDRATIDWFEVSLRVNATLLLGAVGIAVSAVLATLPIRQCRITWAAFVATVVAIVAELVRARVDHTGDFFWSALRQQGIVGVFLAAAGTALLALVLPVAQDSKRRARPGPRRVVAVATGVLVAGAAIVVSMPTLVRASPPRSLDTAHWKMNVVSLDPYFRGEFAADCAAGAGTARTDRLREYEKVFDSPAARPAVEPATAAQHAILTLLRACVALAKLTPPSTDEQPPELSAVNAAVEAYVRAKADVEAVKS